MALDERLLMVLACAIDKGALLYFAEDETLYNPRLRRLYHVESDIPLMCANQASPVDTVRHEELVRRAPAEASTTLDVPVAELVASAREPARPHREPEPAAEHALSADRE